MTTLEAPVSPWRDRLVPDPDGQAIAWEIDALGPLLRGLNAQRVLLIVSPEAVEGAGLWPALHRSLAGLDIREIVGVTPNPPTEEGAAAARAAAEHGAHAVVAVGGGSCLDVAKMAALAARHPDRAAALAAGQGVATATPIPLVAVPTTSGTGSETTHFAAIYVAGRKVSVAHPGLRPTAAVLDVRLHQAMPRRLAAVSGLDALGQAMESLWAVAANEQSMHTARLAGDLAGRHLVASVNGGGTDDRGAMMVAAHLAGRSINISKTTASHALSYALTTRYGLAHGHGVALTLGALAEANAAVSDADCVDPRGAAAVRGRVVEAVGFLGVAPEGARDAVRRVLVDLGLAPTLGEAGVPEGDLPALAEVVDPVRLGNNPRRLSAGLVEWILRASLV